MMMIQQGKHIHIGLPANTNYYSLTYNNNDDKLSMLDKVMKAAKPKRAMIFINDSRELKVSTTRYVLIKPRKYCPVHHRIGA
jgi:negative regulator of replication initiation